MKTPLRSDTQPVERLPCIRPAHSIPRVLVVPTVQNVWVKNDTCYRTVLLFFFTIIIF